MVLQLVLAAALAVSTPAAEISPIAAAALAPSGPPVRVAANPSPLTLQCELPVLWHIGEIDPRHPVTHEELSDAIRQAAILWGEATGGKLLFREEASGENGSVEIRLVFDERQEALRDAREGQTELAARSARIEASRSALDSMALAVEAMRTDHQERNRAYVARTMDYNRFVASLNESGGATPAMNIRLSEMATELDEEKRVLDEATAELNRQVEELATRRALLSAEVTSYNEARDALARQMEASAVLESAYLESRRVFGPFTTSVTRAIEIYAFEDRYELVHLLARELGRALGLPLSEVPGSIMAGTAPRGRFPELHPSDVEALRAVCP